MSIKNKNEINLTHSRYIISPDDIYKLLFDLLGILLVFYQTIMVPLEICFNYSTDFSKNFNFAIDIFFFVDMMINFNTGVYIKGVLVMNRAEISKQYVKGWLWFDLINSFPYSYVLDVFIQSISVSKSQQNLPKILRLVRIIRFLKLIRILRIFKRREIFEKIGDMFTSDLARGIIIYIKTMCIFFFIWHYCACLWFALAIDQYESSDQSISKLDGVYSLMQSESKYTFMLYFTITTFFSVGYGDIKPRSTNEKLFNILLMVIFNGLFCFMVSTIRSIIQKMAENEAYVKLKLRQVRQYMKEANLPKDLEVKVTKYFQFILDNKINHKMNEEEVFSLLNNKLAEELRTQLKKEIFHNFVIFRSEANNISDILYEQVINPFEIIIEEGDIIDKRIYFIQKGSVLLFHQASTVLLKVLGENSYLGEAGFFTKNNNLIPRSASVVTQTYCSIYFIRQSEFLDLINKSTDVNWKTDMNKLYENTDRAQFFSKLNIKCYYCKEFHFIKDCSRFTKKSKHSFICKYLNINQFSERY